MLSIQQLENGEKDLTHVADFSTTKELVVTDRKGNTKPSLQGVIADLKAFNMRGPWSALTEYKLKDVVSYNGIAYVAVTGHVSGSSFESDLTGGKFSIYQGVTSYELEKPTGSSLIGFKLNKIGSYLRSLFLKVSESINVDDYGAIGSGSHPLSERFATLADARAIYPFVNSLSDEIDWAAFQAAINAVYSNVDADPVINFSAKNYVISSPLITPAGFAGLTLKGKGVRSPLLQNNHGTSCTYTGAGLMFPFASAAHILIQDIGMIGNKSSKCFKFTQPSTGSGLSTYSRVLFQGWASCLHFGNLITDGGCADVGFDFVLILDCDNFMSVNNLDGANYSFNRLYVNNCPSIINSVSGSFNFKNTQIVSCGSDSTPAFNFTAVGDNSGFVIFDGMRFEQGTVNLISMAGKGRLTCNGLEEAQPNTNKTQFTLTGIDAEISSSRFTSGSTANPLALLKANGGSQRSDLSFVNCYFNLPAAIEIYSKLVGFVNNGFANSYKINSCMAGSAGNPLPNMGGRAYENKVILCGKTSGLILGELTTDGMPGNVNNRLDAQYDFRSLEITVLAKGPTGYARFIRNVIYSNAGVIDVQNIGVDKDTIGGVILSINAADNNGLFVNVMGLEGKDISYVARCELVCSGFL